jgi:hypothetical protein
MRLETMAALLGRNDLPGTPEELAVLGARLEDLIRLNGEQWVLDNRRKLLSEWEFIVARRIISPS